MPELNAQNIHWFIAGQEPEAENLNGEIRLQKLTANDFAKHFGKHPSEINRMLASLNIRPVRRQFNPFTATDDTPPPPESPLHRARQKATEEKKARIIALYKSGLTLKEVAQQENVTMRFAANTLQVAGVVRPQGTPSAKSKRAAKVVEMANSGMTQTAIAKELGVTPSAVCQILKRERAKL